MYKVTQNSRTQDRLPEQPLIGYLCKELPDYFNDTNNESFVIEQLQGGASNLTYRVSQGETSVILRRPPSGTKAKTAHDMVREARVIASLDDHYSAAPKVLKVCEDHDVVGSDFFLMDDIRGDTIGKKLPFEASPEQCSELCLHWVHKLVELHSLDITTPDIRSLGKPEGYVERQLTGWIERYKKAQTPDVPDIDFIAEWLNENLPKQSTRASFIHNDFKFDNMILDKDNPTEIIGVVDWEMSTLGDPLLDLGCSLAYWVEANDPTELQMIRRMPTHLPGMFSRDQVFEVYCKEMGFKDLTQQSIKPYYIFGLFRLAGIAQQIYYRFYHGQTDNPMFKDFGKLVGILVATAIRNIREFNESTKEATMSLQAQTLFGLQGKNVLITGASRGIGEAVARLFVANGANVIISSRNQEALDELAKDIGSDKVTAMACHIGEHAAMSQLLENIKRDFGKIDVLINNAATNPFFGELLDTPDSAIEKTIDVNIKGYLTMSQLVGKQMRDTGGGVIINTASVNGVIPAPMQGIYSMTKATVMSMTAALAKECAKYNIRVNAVLPGLTDTKFAQALTKNEKMLKMILPLIPMNRMAQPEEIAPAFLFLASDAASYITGVQLPVDGGLLC
ncbi:glucose 1-dehydrogenase [Pleionea litopenaei]|uniref:Glucose 1-dehydrogenase n=1 Tax=Pleionea litopenaei TaxID=3070815 RepID=A0AA51RVJ4_9GAMM|nr:glucose 1-dehydrogenase [Pleionea sp. HL-JVS1]WMS88295.1 glucose 1-dehydrogenase [Pleionea sp. HL-JVS1]